VTPRFSVTALALPKRCLLNVRAADPDGAGRCNQSAQPGAGDGHSTRAFRRLRCWLAMWIAHVRMFSSFRGLRPGSASASSAQNLVGSLFNSHLFDFTQGWLYVFGGRHCGRYHAA